MEKNKKKISTRKLLLKTKQKPKKKGKKQNKKIG